MSRKTKVVRLMPDGTEKPLNILGVDCPHSAIFPNPTGVVTLVSGMDDECVQLQACPLCFIIMHKALEGVVDGRIAAITVLKIDELKEKKEGEKPS